MIKILKYIKIDQLQCYYTKY